MVKFHHCQFESPDGSKPSTQLRQAGPGSDNSVFVEIKHEACKFCGRKRYTRTTVTTKYDPKALPYEPNPEHGLIPVYPTDHLVVRDIYGKVIPGPTDLQDTLTPA